MHYALTINTDGIITGVHESRVPINETTFAANPELSSDSLQQIDAPAAYRIGEHALCYDENGARKPDVWCIQNGYMQLPPFMEIVDGELIQKETPAEERSPTLEEYFREIVKEARDETKAQMDALQQDAYRMSETAKQASEALVDEVAQSTQHTFSSMKPLMQTLMVNQPAAVVLPLMPFMEEWREGKWTAGVSLLYLGLPYKVLQTHDSQGNPGWNPLQAVSLFAPWHGISLETAQPWKKPIGAHDMYKADEYMVFTDGRTYCCLQDTAYSPAEYPQAWKAINDNPEEGITT